MSDSTTDPSMSPDMMDDPDGYGMMNGGYGMMDGGSDTTSTIAVVLLGLLVLALIAGLVVLVLHLRRTSAPAMGATSGSPDDATRIIEGRLARGEVSPEEYHAVRTALESS